MNNNTSVSVSVLARNALLVQLRINQWSGIKQDQRARATVETTHKTDVKVGNYQKKLLPGAKELDTIRNVSQGIRQFVEKNTLPWYADGTGILSSQVYMKFIQEFNKKKMDFEMAVNEFFNKYDSLKNDAMIKLGDLYSDADYPTIEQLKESFNCEVTFMPVPDVTDFRVELSEIEKERFMNKMKQAETDAKVEVYNRLKEVISKAAHKLSEPDAVFRDSLINNINDLLNMVPSLNVTEDIELERIRNEVYAFTSQIVPDACRDVKQYRETVAKDLNSIVDKMSMFMGSAS